MPTVKIPVSLVGAEPNEATPDLALFRLVEGKAPERVAKVDGGTLTLDPARLKGATLAIGPDSDPASLDLASLSRFRADQVLADWTRDGLRLPRERWFPFLTETICVSGHVRKCRPWYLTPAYQRAAPRPAKIGVQLRAELPRLADLSESAIILPWRCLPLCDGIVEIYEKHCCCTTFVWQDLVDRLRDILKDIPILIRWPVPPIPDPGPLARIPGVGPIATLPGVGPLTRVTGLANSILPMRQRPTAPMLAKAQPLERTIPSERVYADYQALLKTPPAEVEAFITKRPYLASYICRCTQRKVGEVAIQPGGEFDFCYRRPLRLTLIRERCFTNFAYRVRQQVGGVWITVYDGLAGNDWFSAGESAELRTSHPAAKPCGDGPTPPDSGDGTPFVMLEHVTGAGTHHFNFPAQTGLSNMAALDANDGLIDFAGVPDAPWASGLGLRLWVSPTLEGIVAFYRMKVVAVNGAGDPVGTERTLDAPVSWARYVTIGGVVQTIPDALAANPSTVGGETGLFRVPYWSGGMDWLSGQYHQVWNTTDFADGKYMLVVELFGPGGARIKPNGAPAGDPGTARPFQFRRWTSQTVTANVPFGDCGHVFWINNRPVNGDIVDLRRNGTPSTDECQFMSGPGTTTVSVGFRAFHYDGVTTGGGATDTNSFMAGYSLTWQRGLNGPSGGIENGTADQGETPLMSPPVLPPEESNTLDFATLLGAFPPTHAAHTRCTFSVHLHVNAKHHNGGGFIDAYDYNETASFALELTPS
ncbi:hypothetical protein [Sandaracinobacteroides saxicola]|uniref:Uncharacterized protein n=1 Tax=Sandaracinobacteroides saxicola TaxID=2759707 RepID=A0A7G5IL93_9SPHN|nr:hypothetical protein [Sandaracinobacteroides saxicola]QMW24135.1 hypothetical protein H3309_06670 [Sandaracinobacteroides saxicola]